MFFAAMTISFAAHAESSPVGMWKTIDDETKAVKSIVEIKEENGKLQATILKLFRKPEEDQNPKCDKCHGDLKDQPIIGLRILNGMKQDGNQWSGGEILDPKNGKTYSCKLELIEEGKKLKVRGFIGFSLLGRTQIWEREEAPAVEATPVAEPASSESKSEADTKSEKTKEAPIKKTVKSKKAK